MWGAIVSGRRSAARLSIPAAPSIDDAKVSLIDEAERRRPLHPVQLRRAPTPSARWCRPPTPWWPRRPGSRRFERKHVIVGTQEFVSLDLKMEVGAVSESVQVTEEIPLIEASTASQGQVLDRQKLDRPAQPGPQPVHDVQARAERDPCRRSALQPHAGPERLLADLHRRRPRARQQLPARRHPDHRRRQSRHDHSHARSRAGGQSSVQHLRRRNGAHRRRHVQYLSEVRHQRISRQPLRQHAPDQLGGQQLLQ